MADYRSNKVSKNVSFTAKKVNANITYQPKKINSDITYLAKKINKDIFISPPGSVPINAVFDYTLDFTLS